MIANLISAVTFLLITLISAFPKEAVVVTREFLELHPSPTDVAARAINYHASPVSRSWDEKSLHTDATDEMPIIPYFLLQIN